MCAQRAAPSPKAANGAPSRLASPAAGEGGGEGRFLSRFEVPNLNSADPQSPANSFHHVQTCSNLHTSPALAQNKAKSQPGTPPVPEMCQISKRTHPPKRQSSSPPSVFSVSSVALHPLYSRNTALHRTTKTRIPFPRRKTKPTPSPTTPYPFPHIFPPSGAPQQSPLPAQSSPERRATP